MYVLINLKAYACDPVDLGEAAAAVDSEGPVSVAVAPQVADIASTVDTGATVWAQHVDPIEAGSHTGSIHAERVAANGAKGTVLNHSERRLRLADIDRGIDAARRVGLTTCVCANTPQQIGAVANLGPDIVAIEPPQLIGTGTPVSQADPEIVLDAIDAARTVDPGIDVWCGAGISSGDDIVAAADLGADGVLIASAIATADRPEAALRALVEPLG